MQNKRPFFYMLTVLLLLMTFFYFVLLLPVTAVSRTTSYANPNSLSLPHIIFITVDATRADHISAYGYGRATTPNVDALLAEQGALFTQATTPSSWTFPSNAGTLTGRMPSTMGVNWTDDNARIPDSEIMLAEYLQNIGYHTAGFISAHYARGQFGFDQGFNVYQELVGNGATTTDAAEINALATNWLQTEWLPVISGTQPLFLYLYYYDPHTWYNPPPPYDTLYDATYTGTLTAEIYRDGQDVVTGVITPTARDIVHLQALYDGEITYWDNEFGTMMAYLESLSLLDNSIIILTSDHGQMFGEHGKWVHHNSVYEEVLRVPLIIRYTGVISPGTVITTPVTTIDVTPTVLDWLGIPLPGNMQGISLALLIQGEVRSGVRSIYSETDGTTDVSAPDYWIAPRHDLRAVRYDNWKYIHQVVFQGEDELYEMQTGSQYEVNNVIDDEPDTAVTFQQMLIDYFDLPTNYLFLPAIRRN
ncbi:MAG: sulfatase [Anaerolineae bacterium]|nr:sulfatase [Anaerolineae bacterium]